MSTCTAYSPDRKTCVTASLDYVVRVIDQDTNEVLKELHGHRAPVRALAVTNGRRTVVSTAFNQTVFVWHLSADSVHLVNLLVVGGTFTAVALTSDGRRVATASTAGVVHVWDSRAGKKLLRIPSPGHYFQMVFSPDCRLLLLCVHRNWLWIRDARTGMTLDLHAMDPFDPFTDYEFSKDGNVVEANFATDDVFRWNLTSKWKFEVWAILSTPKWDAEMARELSHFF